MSADGACGELGRKLELALPLGSRLGPASSQGQIVNVAGSLGIDGDLDTWPDAATYTTRSEIWNTDACVGGPGLWRAATNALGAILPTDRALPALTNSQLQQTASLPAAYARTFRAAPIWAQVSVQRTAMRRYLIDWGQTVMTHAEQIGIAWVAPPDFVELGPRSPFLVRNPEGSVWVQALLACDLARCEGSDTSRRYTLTQTYFVDAQETRSVVVPPGAVSLQISRDQDGITLTTWARCCFGLAGTTGVRRTTSIRIEQGQSVLTSIAPHVTHIELPTLGGEEQALWTLTWEIQF